MQKINVKKQIELLASIALGGYGLFKILGSGEIRKYSKDWHLPNAD